MCACGKPIPPNIGRGRPRKSCGPDCAEKAKVAGRESDARPRAYVRVGVRSFECIHCCETFASPRARKYCSDYCKERAKHLKRRPDAPARGPQAALIERPCACCGVVFKPRRAAYGTYCSRECGFKGLAIRRRLTASPHSGWQCRVYFKSCAHCGTTWTARHKSTPVCSADCGRAVAAAKERARNLARCGDKGMRPCKSCGADFAPTYGDKRSVFCSAKCGAKQHRREVGKTHRKRARKYGVQYQPVNRLRVFNRDGWRCQICGQRTPRRLMGSMAMNAPELDHRVPMSRGGSHTYANVQCACRGCNIEKGNRTCAGQLPLFEA